MASTWSFVRNTASHAAVLMLLIVGGSTERMSAHPSLIQLAFTPSSVPDADDAPVENNVVETSRDTSRVPALPAASTNQRLPLPASLVAFGDNVVDSTDSRAMGASVGGTNLHNVANGSKSQSAKSFPAPWFGDYSKGESTYDPDDVDGGEDPKRLSSRVSEHGYIPSGQENTFGKDGLDAEEFEESMSGGWSAAWRTRFPQLEDVKAAQMAEVPHLPDYTGKLKHNIFPGRGSIAQVFDMTNNKDAAWFDDSVQHYDYFGRYKPATEKSDRYYWDYNEQSWNVSIGCKTAGCVANATLLTFDKAKLDHAKCRLTFGVHPTDYDDEFNGESVEWLIVNNVRIMQNCRPRANGCNRTKKTTSWDIHECVTDFPLDFFLRDGTTLELASKISDTVDECPLKDNLLSGRAKVTCLVKPRYARNTPPPSPKNPPVKIIPAALRNLTAMCQPDNGTEIHCSNPGCSANATTKNVSICNRPKKGQKCFLHVQMFDTDFDDKSTEMIEWVKVDNKTVAQDVAPGRNPCKDVLKGNAKPTAASLSAQQREVRQRLPWVHQLRAAPDKLKEILKVDITQQVIATGFVNVEAKISHRVDECAKDGYLLNGVVKVKCG